MPILGGRGSGAIRGFGLFGAGIPNAPVIGTATKNTSGVGRINVAFSSGGDGGDTITSYTATSSPGSITASGTTSPITVTGLTQGANYTFTVTATNTIGVSAASSASNSAQASAYTCPSGGSLNSSTGVCTVTSSYNATYVAGTCTCPSGYTYQNGISCAEGSGSGLSCWRCRCRRVGAKILCVPESTTPTCTSAYYTCPSGGTLSGTSCITTSTYNATIA